MNKKLLIINTVLILSFVGLLAATFNTWLNPPYPSRVEIASLAGASKKFEAPPPLRENYLPTTQESVVKQNLFRKERVEYVPPPPPTALDALKPVIPPPNLKVSALMLFSAKKKIAVLEGTYSVLNGPTTIENKTLKKKGYPLGEQIGSYSISNIDKTTVFLDNGEGSLVNLSLASRSPDDQIQRNGNHFFHKNKLLRPAASPVAVGNPPTPTSPQAHISGVPIPAPGNTVSTFGISGSKTQTTSTPQGGVSGAPTTGAQGGVSGAPTTRAQGGVSGAPTGGPRISGG